MPPRRGREQGRPTGGPTWKLSRGATWAAAAPFPATARGHRGRGAHLVTDGNQSEAARGDAGNTAQQSQALLDALNALLALVRSEVQRTTHLPPVTSSSGGAQHSVGAGQGNSVPESGGGQSTGHDGFTSSSQGPH